jgi:protease-4
MAIEPRTPPPPPRPRSSGWGVLFALSALLNLGFFFLCVVGFIIALVMGSSLENPSEQRLRETFHSGKSGSSDKVAIIDVEGVIMDGSTVDFAKKQIEQAAKDDQVKAVVVRIDSPGGSITASDELHRRIQNLCQGTGDRKGKPAVVSMGGLAASGGYYIAMPCPTLFAERTTLTGSIGVYAAFPNIKDLGDKVGFHMEVIKHGAVKDAGSPFKDMTPQEHQLWQDMVDHAYGQFLDVVRQGRPAIKDLTEVVIRKTVTTRDPQTGQEKEVEFVRTRVDGGIFTADQAKEFGLIDQIGYLEDSIKDVATKAGLGENYRAIHYEKPRTVADVLFGVESSQQGGPFDLAKLASVVTPRLWFLAPQSELAGILSAAGR